MSLIDFYCGGSSAESLKEWDHARFNTYQAEMHVTGLLGQEPNARDINPLFHKDRERIEQVKGWANQWIVDNAIKVTDINPKKRAIRESYWNENYTITLVSGIVSTLATAAGAVGAVVATAVWVKVVCIVATVALGFFAILSFCRSCDASNQSSLWAENPATQVANLRMVGYKEGLEKAWTPEGGHLFIPSEKNYLYLQTFRKWIDRKDDIEANDKARQLAFITEFLDSHLLSRSFVQFALENAHQKADQLGALGDEIADFRIDTKHLNEYFKEQQAQLDKIQRDYLKEFTDKRKDFIKKSTDPYQATETKLKQKRDDALAKLKPEERNNPTNPKVVAIQKKFNDKIKAPLAEKTTQVRLHEARLDAETRITNRAYEETNLTLASWKSEGLVALYPRLSEIVDCAYAILHNGKVAERRFQGITDLFVSKTEVLFQALRRP